VLFVVALQALILIFSVLAERLAWKSIPKMSDLVLSWTLNLNRINREQAF